MLTRSSTKRSKSIASRKLNMRRIIIQPRGRERESYPNNYLIILLEFYIRISYFNINLIFPSLRYIKSLNRI